ncbi:MAG: CHC2 zinc finger domain-containing protein [Gammaproteobacteria bacterium]|nr:CHC2 zinc finger domain-containing protein [Gammaproteobacteria bacterium]
MSVDFQNVIEKFPLTEVASHYIPINKNLANCPFHRESQAQNFHVYRGFDEIERYRCLECHEYGDVVEFVSLIEHCTKSEAVEKIKTSNLPLPSSWVLEDPPYDQSKAWSPMIPSPHEAPGYNWELTYNPVRSTLVDLGPYIFRSDPYHDHEGLLMFWVVRLTFNDGFQVALQVTWCVGPKNEQKWCLREMEPKFPLMGLDALVADPAKYVLLLGSEEDKSEHDRNTDGGAVAVTWFGDDADIAKTDWAPLVGRKIIYLCSDSESNRRAMQRIFKIVEIEKAGSG